MTVYILVGRPPYPHEVDVRTTRFTFVVERVYLRDVCAIVRNAEEVVAVGWPADDFAHKACKRLADRAWHSGYMLSIKPGDAVIVVLPRGVSVSKLVEEPTDENARIFLYRVGP